MRDEHRPQVESSFGVDDGWPLLLRLSRFENDLGSVAASLRLSAWYEDGGGRLVHFLTSRSRGWVGRSGRLFRHRWGRTCLGPELEVGRRLFACFGLLPPAEVALLVSGLSLLGACPCGARPVKVRKP